MHWLKIPTAPFAIVRGRLGGSAMTAAALERTGEAGAVSGGRLIGVGTGPGDPELLTLKAVKALGQADVLAHFAKRGNAGNARAIIGAHARPDWIELPLLYPVTTEIDKNDGAYKGQILDFYEESATAIARHLEAGRTVAVLSEGDPLFMAPTCICMCVWRIAFRRKSFPASRRCPAAGRRPVCRSCRATTC
jgi:hypothetical protein